MEDDQIYRSARAWGYRLSQTEKGQRKLEQLMEIERNRWLIMDGIQEGIDLAEWEKTNNKKSTTMTEEIQDKVHEDYKKGFNLAYVLQKEGGKNHYDSLVELYKDSPAFKLSHLYQGMEAGRMEALKEMHKEQGKEMGAKKEKTENQLRDEQMADMTKAHEDGDFDPEPPPAAKARPGLTPEQIEEVKAYEKWEEQSKMNQEFKETTRRLINEGADNSEFVQQTVEQKRAAEKQKYLDDWKADLEKAKERDKGKSR